MELLPNVVPRFLPAHGSDERQRTHATVRSRPWAGCALWIALTASCDGGDPADAPPTFTELHERVLMPSCVFATCHQSGASAAGMLALDRDVAHANLVDVASSVVTGSIRVVPGDPGQSYVIEKLTNAMPSAGEQMPPDAPLEAERIELVRAWIEAGAADD